MIGREEPGPRGELDRLLRPRGIAIVGGSDDATTPGGMPLMALREHGYAGRIYPVDAARESLGGLRCYPSLDAVPRPCDVAIVAVPAAAVADVVRDCDRAGIGFAVVLSAGFAEVGERGRDAQSRLEATLGHARARVLGPNCQGFLNLKDRVYAGYSSLFENPDLAVGPVAMVTQSGFGYAIAGMAEQAGTGLSYIVSTGNEADLDLVDVLDYFLEQDDVDVLWAYLQGVSNSRRLLGLGARALEAGKPVLVWKVGNSADGRHAARSHSGKLVSEYELYQAAFRQGGFIEVSDVADLVDLSRAWRAGRLPAGDNLGMVSVSGGQAIAIIDQCGTRGLRLAPLSARTVRRLEELAPELSPVANPVDVTRQIVQDLDRFHRVAALVLADPLVHQLVVCNGGIQGGQAELLARELVDLAASTDKPVLVAWSPRPGTADQAMRLLDGARIPCFPAPAGLARAAGALADFARRRRDGGRAAPVRRASPHAIELPARGPMLSEPEARRVIAGYGIPVVREVLLSREEVDSLRTMPFPSPLVVKVASPDIAHKSDAGLVRLDVRSLGELRRAAHEVLNTAEALQARLDGVVVQERAEGLEAMMGAFNDPSFGMTVIFGLGGVWVEALGDVARRFAPLDVGMARSMILETRGSALLNGGRGRPRLDLDALADALARLSWLAADHCDLIQEIDVNPLFVRPAGQGVVATDTLIVLADPTR